MNKEVGKARPFLRWAGSKQKLVTTLSSYWSPKYERYLEPFMGSAQLFFNLPVTSAILSDSNLQLVELFNQIKKNPYLVYKILEKWPVNSENYYEIRKIDPAKLGINQRAARFLYLNRLCFNGLYRTNLKGEFNVPFSGEVPRQICDYDNLKKVSEKLKCAEIISGDFESVIRNSVKKGDFVYLDPPYAVANKRIFNQYGPQTFGLNDLDRTSDLLAFIDSRRAKFVMSYANSSEVLQKFSKWNIKNTTTQRNIAGFAKYRRIDKELMITNIEVSR
ncbi:MULTISPECIES: DNA adenine methylase [unclassified Chitinophaga]|uniref:DNA adenine methylase n=1 Tax=unclassified Chitinophaga TaxID=2619133 RepID=UPI00301051D8